MVLKSAKQRPDRPAVKLDVVIQQQNDRLVQPLEGRVEGGQTAVWLANEPDIRPAVRDQLVGAVAGAVVDHTHPARDRRLGRRLNSARQALGE